MTLHHVTNWMEKWPKWHSQQLSDETGNWQIREIVLSLIKITFDFNNTDQYFAENS